MIFSITTRSFLIFALHLLFSFQGTVLQYSTSKLVETGKFASKLALRLTDPFPDHEPLLLSKQISEERLFVFFLLKSVLKSGPKWTRTTDLTLIRRAL